MVASLTVVPGVAGPPPGAPTVEDTSPRRRGLADPLTRFRQRPPIPPIGPLGRVQQGGQTHCCAAELRPCSIRGTFGVRPVRIVTVEGELLSWGTFDQLFHPYPQQPDRRPNRQVAVQQL